MRVVPPFGVAEDGEWAFGVRRKAVLRQTLDFKRREEALGHSVVVGIAARSHRWSYTQQLAAPAEGKGAILRPLVRVTNHVRRASLCRRHVKGVEDEAGVQRVAHAPAHDAPAEDIEHDGEVQKTRHRRDVRDVRDPELIGRGRAKRPFDQIGGPWRLRSLPPWPRRPTALGDALQALGAQQASDALLANTMAGVAQITEQTGRAVGSSDRACAARMTTVNSRSRFARGESGRFRHA